MKSDRINSEGTAGKLNVPGYALPGDNEGMDPNLRLIRLFNHYRHDWMNDIQVLFGYVKLKKYDKLEDLMEKIKTKVQRESFISKLGNPELIVYLLSFQAEVKDVLLEIEMDREIHLNELPLDLQELNRILTGFIEAFKSNAIFHADGEHYLTVKFVEEADLLRIDMQYRGLLAIERLTAELKQVKLDPVQTVKQDTRQWDEKYAALQLELPFHT